MTSFKQNLFTNFACICFLLQEYFLADSGVSIYPVSFSLMASFMSAITLLGLSTEIYTFGTLFVVINLSYGVATAISAFYYLPVFYKLQATSAYEVNINILKLFSNWTSIFLLGIKYLEKRFGTTARLCASIAYSLQMMLYMGIVLYAPALALEAVTNISKTNSILIIGNSNAILCQFLKHQINFYSIYSALKQDSSAHFTQQLAAWRLC